MIVRKTLVELLNWLRSGLNSLHNSFQSYCQMHVKCTWLRPGCINVIWSLHLTMNIYICIWTDERSVWPIWWELFRTIVQWNLTNAWKKWIKQHSSTSCWRKREVVGPFQSHINRPIGWRWSLFCNAQLGSRHELTQCNTKDVGLVRNVYSIPDFRWYWFPYPRGVARLS